MSLRRLREQHGLNQTELGEAIGMHQSSISRAEDLAPNAVLRTYLRCAEFFKVPLKDLFADERTPQEEALLRTFRSLLPHKQQQWEALLRVVQAGPAEEADTGDKTGDQTEPEAPR